MYRGKKSNFLLLTDTRRMMKEWEVGKEEEVEKKYIHYCLT